jgi:hypothetical protein
VKEERKKGLDFREAVDLKFLRERGQRESLERDLHVSI